MNVVPAPLGAFSNRFSGELDDLEVFDGTVSDTHVAQLFTAANPCAPVAVLTLK
jgi:hypothetical protein